MSSKYIRKDLKEFIPYKVVDKEYSIKVDANENPYEHNKDFAKYMYEFFYENENIIRYPDTNCKKLVSKISEYYKISKNEITVGVGSDQLLECVSKAFLEVGDTILAPNPSFSMYGHSAILNRGKVEYIELDDDMNYNVSDFLEKIKKVNPKIVYVCNPNNPTGCIMEKQDIISILNTTNGIVVVDEAYGEFYEKTMLDEINNFDNLLILRTFSKAYGLAALRLGIGFANKELIDAIEIVKPPYAVPMSSQVAGVYMLEHANDYSEMVKKLIKGRIWLIEKLNTCSCVEKVFDSYANFILVKLKDKLVADKLLQNKILVRNYKGDKRLDGHIRISVGTDEENKKIIQIMKEG